MLLLLSAVDIRFFTCYRILLVPPPNNDGVAMSNELLNHAFGGVLPKLRWQLRAGKACT
ncbi:MAG TPA: hypothetical protein VGD63_09935 [Steroidobacteraceae bacterium]